MKRTFFLTAPLLFIELAAGAAGFEVRSTGGAKLFVPPAPPAMFGATAAQDEPAFSKSAAAWSVGDPSPEEQLYIEFINRARADAVAESLLLANTTDLIVRANMTGYGVDVSLMQSQFATNPPAQPLAPNAQLTAAARRHSADMLANSFQEHVGSDGSTSPQRVSEAGYNYAWMGENVFANASSVFHGHAGFEVDWGDPAVGPVVGGMQAALGHRKAIHNPVYREVGVGVLFGRNTPAPGSQIPGTLSEVGPQLVTQEFGVRQNDTPLITGVTYFDLNGNNFYDIGEGIGGLQVSASGTTTQGVTARSGGYAMPVAGNGNYTVTFSGEGLAAVTREVTVADQLNEKLDLIVPYVAPIVTGTTNPVLNQPNTYQISPVPAAQAYQWRSFQLATPVAEGAENGSNRVTIVIAGNYDVFEATSKNSGAFSFHLAHPQDGIADQIVLLKGSYLVEANSALNFASLLGWATEDQTAKVQVSTDNGVTWTTVYSQSGVAGGPNETSFQDRLIELSDYAGETIRIRFVFVPSGTVYIDTDSDTGWFIDDITFENMAEVSNEVTGDATSRTFTFQPAAFGNFIIQGRARTGHDYLPWGENLPVTAVEGAPTPLELRVDGVRVANGQVELDVEVVAGTAPTGLALESKTTLGGTWSPAAGNVQVVSGNQFRITTTARGGMGFYRVRAQ